jgi:hypothetical protein
MNARHFLTIDLGTESGCTILGKLADGKLTLTETQHSPNGPVTLQEVSAKRTADRVEYAETAAKYEYINLRVGEIGKGLSANEIRSNCDTFNVKQDIF